MEPIIRHIRLALYGCGNELPPPGSCPLPEGVRVDMIETSDAMPPDLPGMPEHRDAYRRRFAGGHLLCRARSGEETAHAIWIARNKLRVDEIQRSLILKETSCIMYQAETRAEFRGRGIYPALLTHIARRWREQGGDRVYIYSDPDNRASVRGIEKAGLTLIGGMSCVRLPGGLRLFKHLTTPEPL